MRNYLSLILVLTSLFITPCRAQEKADFSTLALTGEEQVEEIIDPLRLRLQDGRIVQLAGIDIPDLTPYDSGAIGLATMDFLKEKLTKKRVKLYQGKDAKKDRTNRMGYHIAHLVEKTGDTWIQGALLEAGLARVRPDSENTEMAEAMMALEGAARAEKRGLWADEAYAVLRPETAARALHNWGIVEGTIRASAMAKNTVFLNFGADWRTDFTIGLPSDTRRKLINEGIDPLQLGGKHVRVRGWIESYNGPYIKLDNPVWMEILPDSTENATLP